MTLQLENPAHWEEIYSQIHRAVVVIPGRSYDPIPPIDIPGIQSTQYLNCVAESQLARETWRLGGWLYQVVEVPGRSDFVDLNASKNFVPINDARLIFLPRLAPTYRLRFEVPWWHEEISLTIWRYTGPEDTLTVLVP